YLTSATDISLLSLHDALPIYDIGERAPVGGHDEFSMLLNGVATGFVQSMDAGKICRDGLLVQHLEINLAGHPLVETQAGFPATQDRKSTRLNSSHVKISYAVF